MRTFVTLGLLGLVAFWSQPGRCQEGDPGQRLPNVVIILVDDMGYGDPGCFNPQSKIPTPNIDALARDGMRFTDAHAPGAVCHPSRYGLLTGCYPFRTDVSVWPRSSVIDRGQMTIASLLKSRGYRTAMVGKWHLGFDEKGYDKPLRGGPVDRGFDSFFGIRASTDIPPYFFIRDDRAVAPPTGHIEASHGEGWSPVQEAFWRAGGIASDLKLEDVLPRFTEEAILWHGLEKIGPGDTLYLRGGTYYESIVLRAQGTDKAAMAGGPHPGPSRAAGIGYRLVHFRWIEGCHVAEVAARLDLTSEQVRYRHHRVKKRLRRLLECHGARPETGSGPPEYIGFTARDGRQLRILHGGLSRLGCDQQTTGDRLHGDERADFRQRLPGLRDTEPLDRYG